MVAWRSWQRWLLVTYRWDEGTGYWVFGAGMRDDVEDCDWGVGRARTICRV